MTNPQQLEVRNFVDNGDAPATPLLIKELETLGIAHQIRGQKVLLSDTLELLDPELIATALSEDGKSRIHAFDIFWTIDSTNTWLLKRVDDDDFDRRVCTAEQQVAGKGRRGRHWVSPFGKNIYLSLGWQFSRDVSGIGGLSLVVGMAVADVLRECGLNEVGLKWPNDVLFDDGKLAGILLEMEIKDEQYRLVVGVGVNLSLTETETDRIDQAFSTASGRLEVGRNVLLARLVDRISKTLSDFAEKGLSPHVQRWEHYDVYLGQAVEVLIGDKKVHGVDRGIDIEGNLLVETDDGVASYNAGEVSLRPAARKHS